MRIDKNIPNPTSALLDASQPAKKAAITTDQPAASVLTDAHQSSPDLARLLQALQKQSPDARQGLLQEISQRLASGYYLTPQAADGAAKAISGI
jgi:hypothetical protein